MESAKRQRGQIPRDSVLSSGAASTPGTVARGWRGRGRRVEGELISSTHAHWAALPFPRDSPGIPHNIPSPPTPLACFLLLLFSSPLLSSLSALFTSVPCSSCTSWISRRVAVQATGLSNFPRENGELFLSLFYICMCIYIYIYIFLSFLILYLFLRVFCFISLISFLRSFNVLLSFFLG